MVSLVRFALRAHHLQALKIVRYIHGVLLDPVTNLGGRFHEQLIVLR